MEKIKFVFKPYISILFLGDVKAGFLLLCLSFILPSVGILGLVALFATVVFSEIINLRDEYLKYGFYLYNSLLVGMGVGYYFEVTFTTILLTLILAILTFLISFSLNKILIKYSLPILSLPFAFVSMIFYLASLKYTSLLSNILDRHPLFDISLPFEPFFKSMGTIFFLPYTVTGFIISLIILFYSRILFFSAILGFVVGVFAHSIFIPFEQALNSHYNFNFILISMALCGVFLVPHYKNFILSIIAVILAVVMIDSMEVFFNIYALPVYTLPFNVITLLFVFILFSTGYKFFNYNIKETPEKSLTNFLSNFYRFGGNDIKINLPFIGVWNVYQAFDDKWTHKGDWKYAYDFVIKKNDKTYKNEGLFLDDYYAFAKPITSPVNGYVVALRDDLVDNFIGNVDRVNNWGNYIIIKSDYGYFVEISHLMQHSLNVKVGDYVTIGQIIAKCGNSGYSPEPHIHMQVQTYGVLGSVTIAFKFIDYIQNDKLYFYSLPKRGENIEATIADKAQQLRLNFILDDTFKYEVIQDDKQIDKFEMVVKMDDKGQFYFTDSKNKLYFYKDEKLFYFYDFVGDDGYLKELFKVLPKMPLNSANIEYTDVLALEFRYNSISKIFMQLILPFNYKLFDKKFVYKKENLKIISEFGEVSFSFYDKGFESMKLKNIILRRIHEENNTNN